MSATREELKRKLEEVEKLKSEYIQALLEQRKTIDAELAELGYKQERASRGRGGTKGPMSEETKRKISESRKGKKKATAGGSSVGNG